MTLHGHILMVALVLVTGQAAAVTMVAAASDCGPAARVEGDGPVADAVVSDLHRHGIATPATATCPVVRARVERSADGLDVTIEDAEGRTVERTANGPAAAAILIESWTRTDVVAPLLAPRSERLPTGPPLISPEASPPTLGRVMVASSRTAVLASPALSATASGEASLATDGSIWFGVSAGVCLAIGPVCAGVLARMSSDAGFSGESEDMHTGRLATDVLLGVGLPIRRGRLTFLPGLAIGLGWMRTSALPSSIGGDSITVDSGGLRASASTRVSLKLSTYVALDLGIAADVAPLSHAAPYDTQLALLAGEPLGYFRGSLGVRIGAP